MSAKTSRANGHDGASLVDKDAIEALQAQVTALQEQLTLAKKGGAPAKKGGAPAKKGGAPAKKGGAPAKKDGAGICQPCRKVSVCKYGRECNRFDCMFLHPEARRHVCAYGSSCGNRTNPKHEKSWLHPGFIRSTACRDGDNCRDYSCHYQHNVDKRARLCRYGMSCPHIDDPSHTEKFLHPCDVKQGAGKSKQTAKQGAGKQTAKQGGGKPKKDVSEEPTMWADEPEPKKPVVFSWNEKRGFGFIDNDGEHIYVHRTNLVGVESLEKGDEVSFDRSFDDVKEKYEGLNVRKL